MKLIKERSMAVVYDAVSISKDIEAIGGPTTLNFYADSNTFVPNRFLTPLVLKPIVYIADPNKVIPDGDKSKELTECYWFENGVKIATGDDYRINEDNTLTVLKNSQSDLEISFSAKWLDPRKGQEITIEDSIKLVCISLSEEGSNPRITLDRPINWIHNPLKGERIYSIKAYISKDKVYEGAVEWYYTKQKGKPELINKEHLFYVEGQYTNELKVNSIYLEDGIITAKNLSNDKLKEYYWFFDKNGNPISYNEPLFTELKGADTFSLPPETLENKAKLYLDGLTIQNIVKNGDFSDGLDGWKIWKANVSGNVYNLTTGGSITTVCGDNINTVGDKMYYLVQYLKKSSGIMLQINNVHKDINIDMSGVVEITSKGLVGFALSNKHTEGVIEKPTLTIVNLTELFGKGNEPSKEWCDEHIKGYINGTQSVKLPMRVRSVGVNQVGHKNIVHSTYSLQYFEDRLCIHYKAGGNVHQSDKLMYNLDFKKGDDVYISLNIAQNSKMKYQLGIVYDDLSVKNLTSSNISELLEFFPLEFNFVAEKNIIGIKGTYINGQDVYIDLDTFYVGKSEQPEKYTESTGYITNNTELRSLPKIKDYIKDGKIYKNIARYYFSDKDNWTLREEYKGDNFRYSMTLPLEYKATGNGVEGELFCNNYTATSNVVSVLVKRDSNTIALYKENSSTIYLTLDKKVDNVNSIIPEGTFVDVILPETEILDLHTEGKLISYPDGTIFLDYFNREEGVYKDGFTLSKEFTLDTLVYISRNTQDIDVNKATIKDGILTHPDLNKGEYIQIGYTYKDCSIYGDNTIEYLNLANLLDEIIVEDVYTYRPIKDNEGLITDWEFIKLTDIEDYNKWLKEERTSPYSLAPDGIIFGQYSTQTKFLRQFPSSLEADFILPSRLKEGTKNVTARAIIKTSKEIINNPENFFKITWYRRPNKPGADNIVIGEGEQVTLDVAHKDAIILEVEDLGVLKPVKDNRGRYLLDNQDKIITTR